MGMAHTDMDMVTEALTDTIINEQGANFNLVFFKIKGSPYNGDPFYNRY
jgi:hypothetical protein